MKNFVFILFFSCLFASCADDKTVYCTMEYRIVTIGVVHSDGSPYELDSVKSFLNTTDGVKDVSITDSFSDIRLQYAWETGLYSVADDDFEQYLPDSTKPMQWDEIRLIGDVEFAGYKDGQELFRKTIKVYTDFCHVFCDEKDLQAIVLE